jgi:hypothetical protein
MNSDRLKEAAMDVCNMFLEVSSVGDNGKRSPLSVEYAVEKDDSLGSGVTNSVRLVEAMKSSRVGLKLVRLYELASNVNDSEEGICECQEEDSLPDKLGLYDVQSRIVSEQFETFGKTTVGHFTLVNGFEIVTSSACVDPANYDHEIGCNLCRNHAIDKIWELEGYLLQQKRYEVNNNYA